MPGTYIYLNFEEARAAFEPDHPNAKLGIMVEQLNRADGVVPDMSAPISTFFSGGAGWDEAQTQIDAHEFKATVLFFSDDIEEAYDWSRDRGGHMYTGGAL